MKYWKKEKLKYGEWKIATTNKKSSLGIRGAKYPGNNFVCPTILDSVVGINLFSILAHGEPVFNVSEQTPIENWVGDQPCAEHCDSYSWFLGVHIT